MSRCKTSAKCQHLARDGKFANIGKGDSLFRRSWGGRGVRGLFQEFHPSYKKHI